MSNWSDKVSTVKIGDAIIEYLRRGIIARTNLGVSTVIGSTSVVVENTFQFNEGEEIVLIDNGYNNTSHAHYNVFEYATIQSIVDVNTIELVEPLQGNWNISDEAAVQKTIGHSPLFPNNILYGDRAVVPFESVAITVEVNSLSNDWIYIRGGLSEEYQARIVVYGLDIKMENGKRILDKYTDAVYTLLNENIHLNIDNDIARLIQPVSSGDNYVIVENNAENLSKFTVNPDTRFRGYRVEDVTGASCWIRINSQDTSTPGELRLNLNSTLDRDYNISDFPFIMKYNTYVYDSRINSVNFGQVQKESAMLRAAELNWFGKIVNEHAFPQRTKKIPYFS